MNPGLETSQTSLSVLLQAWTPYHIKQLPFSLGLPMALTVSQSFQVLNDLDGLEVAMKRVLFISLSRGLFDGFLMIVSEF